MIVYVDSKTKKVDLTKEQLEKLLKEEYDRGYKDGEKTNPPITYSCPYGYWYCPYRGNTITTTPTITWTYNSTDTAGTVVCGDSNMTINSNLGTVKE